MFLREKNFYFLCIPTPINSFLSFPSFHNPALQSNSLARPLTPIILPSSTAPTRKAHPPAYFISSLKWFSRNRSSSPWDRSTELQGTHPWPHLTPWSLVMWLLQSVGPVLFLLPILKEYVLEDIHLGEFSAYLLSRLGLESILRISWSCTFHGVVTLKWETFYIKPLGASLVAQTVKNPPKRQWA